MSWDEVVSAGLSLFGGVMQSKRNSAQAMQMNKKTYLYNRKLNKQTNDLDYKSAVKLLRKQNAYSQKYLSNSSRATEALNKNLMDYQYALERESRQSAYQDTRKDLESAGYNPLLAVGQQSGYTSVGSGVSTQSEGLENASIANSATDIASKFNEMRNANELVGQGQQKVDIDKLASKYTNDLNSAKAEHERSMTRGQDTQNDISDLYGYSQALENLKLTRSEREDIEKARELKASQIKLNESQGEVNSAQALKARTEASYVGYNAKTDRRNANTARKNYKLAKKNAPYQRELWKSETKYNTRRSSGRNFGANSNASVHGPLGIGFSSGSGFSHGY